MSSLRGSGGKMSTAPSIVKSGVVGKDKSEKTKKQKRKKQALNMLKDPTKRTFKVMEDVPPAFDGFDVSDENIAAIKKSFMINGFVRVKVAKKVRCCVFIHEMWEKIILSQPWDVDYQIKLHSTIDGRLLDFHNPNDINEYFKIITSDLTPQVRKMMLNAWTLHRGFGACCDPVVFHTEWAWGLRQNPKIYRFVKHCVGWKRLLVDDNRK